MSEEQINELIEYNLDYSIEEDLEETKKCLKEANKEIERLNNDRKELISSNVKLREEKIFYKNIINKAIEYINWVWNNTNKPTNTIVALKTLDNILHGEIND